MVAETITLTLKVGHAEAARIGEQLYAEKLARIHWASPEEERAAFAYFKRHQDQAYSFVDCLNFVVMEKLGMAKRSRWTQTLRTGLRRDRVLCPGKLPTFRAPRGLPEAVHQPQPLHDVVPTGRHWGRHTLDHGQSCE